MTNPLSLFSSPFEYSYTERFMIRLLNSCSSKLPAHIACIMDGNRRFARERRLSISDGHLAGFRSLATMIDLCCQFPSVRQLSVYAFSIENFKRTEPEVTDMIRLFQRLFQTGIQDLSEYRRRGIRMRFYGNVQLFPVGLRRIFAKLAAETGENDQLCINFCLAYTGRQDLVRAFQKLRESVIQGRLSPSDIDHQILSSALCSENRPEPDVLIRTSGEIRLSDYFLYQCAYTRIVFLPEPWPLLTKWTLFWLFFRTIFQHN